MTGSKSPKPGTPDNATSDGKAGTEKTSGRVTFDPRGNAVWEWSMNACGHHHVGHIGILGVDKHGEEWYQITIGGSATEDASLGEVIGPSVPQAAVADTIQKLIDVYVEQRHEEERFIDTVRRLGIELFQERVYGVRADARNYSAA